MLDLNAYEFSVQPYRPTGMLDEVLGSTPKALPGQRVVDHHTNLPGRARVNATGGSASRPSGGIASRPV